MFVLHEDWTDRDAWDDFVLRHPEARFCHLFDCEQTVRCYGYSGQKLCFTYDSGPQKGSIAALIPVTRIDSYWYGVRLISQPFCEYGGLLMDARLSDEETEALIEMLGAYLAESEPGAILEMHGSLGVPPSQRERFAQRNPHGLASLSLAGGADALWKTSIKYEVRKFINQARRAGVTVFEECNPAAIREHFFPLYTASMKRLGVPPHKLEYYLACQRAFGERMQIFWAVKDSQRIAALLGFDSGMRTAIVNTVSDPAHWPSRPNDLLHWEYICAAIDRGCSHFDFGSVRYEGQRLYKGKWGCSIIGQAYCFLSPASRPIRTFDSSSPTMQHFSDAWARYMPPRLAKTLGPTIRQFLAR